MLRDGCRDLTYKLRVNLSHTPPIGKTVPDPCAACGFGSDPATVKQEYLDLLQEEARLASDTSKAGKAKFSEWRMKHARAHFNVQPGLHGQPFLQHDFSEQIVDPLHLAELGIPKTAWKHGLLIHASDDARQLISDKLVEWKHPLDCRRKDDNRQRQQKWFTGERWRTFCAGERGSPGGPIAMATLLLMIAEDMQINGAQPVDSQGLHAVEARGRGRGRGSSRGRRSFIERQKERSAAANADVADADVPVSATATLAGAERQPSAMELACDASDLDVIRTVYGSRAQVGRPLLSSLAMLPFLHVYLHFTCDYT